MNKMYLSIKTAVWYNDKMILYRVIKCKMLYIKVFTLTISIEYK